ncbi:hypothetical protein ACSV5G_11040 [Agrobacterium cavarae]|uniref:hypothetical protein n=1 Tax=Agrobacterium cavarae TaxID=2528239 RepID=UPI0013AEEA9A
MALKDCRRSKAMIGMHPTIRQSFTHPPVENEDNEKDNQRRDLGAITGNPTSPHLPTRSARLASARARAASPSRLSSAQ